jgi:hypothetical protein
MARPFVRAAAIVSAILAAGAFCTTISPSSARAQGGLRYAVRGAVRDSATGLPMTGALIELRSEGIVRTNRTDDDGSYRFTLLPAGAYHISVLRIGYTEHAADFTLRRDTTIRVAMLPAAVRLSEFLVYAETTAVYGAVGAYPDFDAVRGARIQIIGAHREAKTDSVGRFFVALPNPGKYLVRVVADGFADQIFTAEIPRGKAVEASQLLEPGPSSAARAFDFRYADMDLRLSTRGLFASLVSGSEIRKAGGSTLNAVERSEAFYSRGMRMADTTCVFVNGLPRPGMALEAIRPEEIEAVELYGAGPTGSASARLQEDWPQHATCGRNSNATSTRAADRQEPVPQPRLINRFVPRTSPRTPELVVFAVVWTRR